MSHIDELSNFYDNVSNYYHENILLFAINNDIEMLNIFINKHNIDIYEVMNQIVCVACIKDNEDLVEFFITNFMDIINPNYIYNNTTLFKISCAMSCQISSKLFVNTYLDIDIDDNTFLNICRYGTIEDIEFFVSRFTCLNIYNIYNKILDRVIYQGYLLNFINLFPPIIDTKLSKFITSHIFMYEDNEFINLIFNSGLVFNDNIIMFTKYYTTRIQQKIIRIFNYVEFDDYQKIYDTTTIYRNTIISNYLLKNYDIVDPFL